MMAKNRKCKMGLVGYGYWGPNLLRNLVASGAEGVGVVEANAEARARCQASYPHIPVFADVSDFMAKAKPEGVAIATPPSTHREIAIRCIEGGAHVLVEKPLAMSTSECDEILACAEKHGKQLMVDHTFICNPAVQYLADQIKRDGLGSLMYYDSVRVNLGGFQARTNVLWDLAPHDLSILDFITGGETPSSVSCVGIRHFDASIENLCYLHLNYQSKLVAHLHLNWVAPMKIRTVMIGGTKKMAVYDENLPAEKIKIYDKGMSVQQTSTPNDFRVSYRMGDMVPPAISAKEALSNVIADFVKTVATGEPAISDGRLGRRIVRILEAASRSLAEGGKPIELGTDLRVLVKSA